MGGVTWIELTVKKISVPFSLCPRVYHRYGQFLKVFDVASGEGASLGYGDPGDLGISHIYGDAFSSSCCRNVSASQG